MARIRNEEPDARVSFISFEWSGNNSFSARRRASQELVTHLLEYMTGRPQDPTDYHLIIAHSHGGSVALAALEHEALRARRNQIAGIATLATPFINVEPRWGSDTEQQLRSLVDRIGFALLGLLLIGCACTAWLARSHDVELWFLLPLLFTGAGFVLMSITLGIWLSYVGRFGYVRHAGTFGGRIVYWSPRSPGTYKGELLALRVPGDEANSGISSAHMVSVLTEGLWRLTVRPVAHLVDRLPWASWGSYVALYIGLSTIGVLGFTWWYESNRPFQNFAPSIPVFVALVYLLFLAVPSFVASLLVLSIAPSMIALASAVGWEVLFYPTSLAVSVDALPFGFERPVAVLALKSRRDKALDSSRHSIHEFDATRERIADWILDFAGPERSRVNRSEQRSAGWF